MSGGFVEIFSESVLQPLNRIDAVVSLSSASQFHARTPIPVNSSFWGWVFGENDRNWWTETTELGPCNKVEFAVSVYNQVWWFGWKDLCQYTT